MERPNKASSETFDGLVQTIRTEARWLVLGHYIEGRGNGHPKTHSARFELPEIFSTSGLGHPEATISDPSEKLILLSIGYCEKDYVKRDNGYSEFLSIGIHTNVGGRAKKAKFVSSYIKFEGPRLKKDVVYHQSRPRILKSEITRLPRNTRPLMAADIEVFRQAIRALFLVNKANQLRKKGDLNETEKLETEVLELPGIDEASFIEYLNEGLIKASRALNASLGFNRELKPKTIKRLVGRVIKL